MEKGYLGVLPQSFENNQVCNDGSTALIFLNGSSYKAQDGCEN
jgi:hypothetical protein